MQMQLLRDSPWVGIEEIISLFRKINVLKLQVRGLQDVVNFPD